MTRTILIIFILLGITTSVFCQETIITLTYKTRADSSNVESRYFILTGNDRDDLSDDERDQFINYGTFSKTVKYGTLLTTWPIPVDYFVDSLTTYSLIGNRVRKVTVWHAQWTEPKLILLLMEILTAFCMGWLLLQTYKPGKSLLVASLIIPALVIQIWLGSIASSLEPLYRLITVFLAGLLPFSLIALQMKNMRMRDVSLLAPPWLSGFITSGGAAQLGTHYELRLENLSGCLYVLLAIWVMCTLGHFIRFGGHPKVPSP